MNNIKKNSYLKGEKVSLWSKMKIVKLFIWNNFIYKYFKDWLDEYTQEQFECNYEPVPNQENMLWNDLDWVIQIVVKCVEKNSL